MIELKNLNKTFKSEGNIVKAAKNININIQKGEIFGIIGYSGAGKSTLVRCINMLEKPNDGDVIVDGINLMSLTPKELRKIRSNIGMIFQGFNLFESRTVKENILYPLKNTKMNKEEKDIRVKELLKLVDLEDKINVYPSKLSGGQKQRVAIARALATNPKILLCDEATSALDPKTTDSILKLLKQVNIKLGITIVIITHEMNVVKTICDKVAVMQEGRIVEQGDVYSIFANPKEKITIEFIDSDTNISKIYDLIESGAKITKIKEGNCIVKFNYKVNSYSEALVSSISRIFNIDVNIIFGNIELIDEKPLGSLVSILSGNNEGIESALNYLKEKDVEVEVIVDERIYK